MGPGGSLARGLIAAQRATLEIVAELERAVLPGITERELAALAEGLARQRGASGFWTPVAVGAGSGALVCHPDFPPTDRAVAADDLVVLDVTPLFDGWPGDVARSVVVGDDPGRLRVLDDARRIQRTLLEYCRPGLPANELFGYARTLLDAEGYELLDLLGNVGHDLGEGGAVTGFLDPRTETPMWGCWAIEPHIGRDGIAAKFEDLVWLGEEGAVVLS